MRFINFMCSTAAGPEKLVRRLGFHSPALRAQGVGDRGSRTILRLS